MNNFELYAELQSQIKELKEKSDALLPTLMEDVIASGEKNQKFDFGTFSLVERKKYTYSDDFNKMQADLKQAKKYEEKNQTPEVVTTLSFRAK